MQLVIAGIITTNYAIKLVINSYNHFTLPKYRGSGNMVAADGTK